MPLPTLNTSGNNLSNTFLKISQMRNQDAALETRKKQNALLDLQLSPEMQAALKADREVDRASKNALLKQRNLQSNAMAAEQIGKSLGTIDFDDQSGKSYSNYYNKFAANPAFKDHMQMLPKPEDYMAVDLKQLGGKGMTQEKRKQLKGVVGSLMTAAQRKASGMTATYKQAWFPDGTSAWVGVAENVKPGEVVSAEDVTGVAGASFGKFDKAEKPQETWSLTTPGPNGEERMVSSKSGKVIKIADAKKFDLVKVKKGEKTIWVEKSAAVEQEVGEKEVEEKGLTKNQKLNQLEKIQGKFNKTDKDGNISLLATNKEEGRGSAERYNKIAKDLGESSKYVWKEDAFAGEKGIGDYVAGVLPGGETGEPESIGGWVKVEVGETGEEVEEGVVVKKVPERPKENPTEAEVKAMKKGTKFTVNGKTYARK